LTTSNEGLSVSNLEDGIKASATTQSSKDSIVPITNFTVSRLNEKRSERKEGVTNYDDDQSLIKTEKRRKQGHSPSVDDIISGIIQLIGGNVKLGRPNQKHHQTQQPPSQHGQTPGRPLIIPYPGNPTRINNRGPPQIGFAGSVSPNQPHNLLPPSVLIGHDLPAGLPIPIPPSFHYQSSSSSLEIVTNRPLYNSLLTDHSVSIIDDNQLHNSQKQWSSSNLGTTVESSLNTMTFSSENAHSIVPLPTFVNSASNEAETVIDKKTSEAKFIPTSTKDESDKKTILPSFFSSKLDFSLIKTLGFSSSKSKEASFETPTSEISIPSGPITAWVPFFSQSNASSKKVWIEEPPSIITKPEMPSTFDVTVKHKLGPSLASSKSSLTSPTSLTSEVSKILSSFSTTTTATTTTTTTATTTTTTTTTTTSLGLKSSSLRLEVEPTATLQSSPISRTLYSEPDIVYGRLDTIKNGHISKMISPSFHTTGHIKLHGDPSTLSSTTMMKSSSTTIFGRPVIIPVDVEEVKPYLGAKLTPSVITEPGKGSVYIEGRQTRFKIRPNIKTEPSLHVGSGVRINTVHDNHNVNTKPSALIKNQGTRPSIMRRPGFRPRPSTPLVRIDTCIVGDDSTCGSNLNEHCKTEMGISSCQCKPGFGRIAPRSVCVPIVTLSILFRVDRLGENKLGFTSKLQNPETEDYQYLEYESLQALNSLFNSSRLGKIFKGAKVNKFSLFGGKTMVNATVELDRTNATQSVSIKRIVQQEISRLIASRNNNIGDSQLWADGSISTVPRVDDINECSNTELNDCSKFATCFNEFGTFRCVCMPGYEDKYSQDNLKAGRYCASCSPAYCSNRGECLIIDGEKECKCRGNFIGSKCDIDGEVLGVALGGSIAALIIIIITFLCLYMWK